MYEDHTETRLATVAAIYLDSWFVIWKRQAAHQEWLIKVFKVMKTRYDGEFIESSLISVC